MMYSTKLSGEYRETMFPIYLFHPMLIRLSMFTLLLLLVSCKDKGVEEFKENCPYELQYSGHYLRVPISISPHKVQYKVGDTIHINTVFPDSIYDLGTKQTFQIKRFPFRPLSLLYRFYDSLNYDSGYRLNTLNIDSIYDYNLFFSVNLTDGFRAKTLSTRTISIHSKVSSS